MKMLNLKTCLKLSVTVFSLLFFESATASDDITDMNCVIEPESTVEVGSQDEGILSEVIVKRGDRVKKGQLIAKLDSRLEQLNAKHAKYRANMDVQVRSAQAQVDFREKQLERFKIMLSKNAVSVNDFEQAEIELRLAALSAEAAVTDKKIAGMEYEIASARLLRRSIFSPVDGVVESINKSPGEYVHEQAPLMKIVQLDPLYVEVFLPVSDYREITRGMEAEVRPEEPIGGVYQAKIVVVDSVFDAASRTFGVRLELDNSSYELPGGLRCKVTFHDVMATKK